MIEAILFRQGHNPLYEVLPKRAANATILHLHSPQFATHKPRFLQQRRVNVYISHVVHNHSDTQAFTILKDMLQERTLSCANHAAEKSHWQFCTGP
eukprot:CAMPEP_0180437774 /NCGR_PEP_ID=MMETSP1036_2-20121128/11723_1 /TAXON_ID=632150 /ORGANISM="Azadinium spinosum, Strain 3D9" /LENGTH=95 /DNA_ID=CAMNT_0022443847 /DNA_START=520 /DNA_END=807 /DNA_ORIENTATION=-